MLVKNYKGMSVNQWIDAINNDNSAKMYGWTNMIHLATTGFFVEPETIYNGGAIRVLCIRYGSPDASMVMMDMDDDQQAAYNAVELRLTNAR